MNVAKDEGDAGFVELDEARGSAFVESEVEALSLEQRKHIVKKWIVVGKLNFAANRDHQQRRLKAFIFLHELRNLGGFLTRRHDRRANRSQPDDRFRSIGQGMAVPASVAHEP